MSKAFLTTSRLYIRRFTGNDLPLLLELDSDPEVLTYLNPGALPDEAYLRDTIIPRWLQWYQEYDDLGFWAAHEASTDSFIGWFHLRPRKNPETLELGYRLKKIAWGNGYATEMSLALVQLAFRRPETKCVEASAMAANKASIRVMEKVGLRFAENYVEDSFPSDDKRAVRYRLTREEYENAPAFSLPDHDSKTHNPPN